MILPLSDQPNPRGFVPILTYLILFTNVAIYVVVTLPLSSQPADPGDPMLVEYVRVVSQNLPQGVSPRQILEQVSAYDLFVFSHGYRPAAPSLLGLFTAMFLHGGFMHLFGNMLFLWIYGDNVEHRLGRFRYLFWYLATGVAATLFHALLESDSALPLVGASGAISGVLGFYFLWFPRNKVRLWVFLFPFFMDVILVPARIVLGIYLVLENLLPFLITRGVEGAGVAHGAHIGGFLAGLAAAWVMSRREVDQRPEEYRAVRRSPSKAKTAGDPISDAIAAGNFEEAARLYFALPPEGTRRLLSRVESLALGRWLERDGRHRAALVVFQRHLRDYPVGPGAAEAHTHAGLIQLYALGESTAAYQHLVEALGLDPSQETEEAARKALAEIEARQKFQVRRRSQGF
jgi:membrane associated rhomboid family serine protease